MKSVIVIGSFLLINYGSASPYRRKADFRKFSSRIGESKDVFIAVNHDKETGRAEKVCMIDGVSYRDGEAVPTSNQCEFCVCRPPGFACSLLQCAPPRNKACRVLQKSGACCPEYLCDCEKNGKIYKSGQKIIDPENPCDVCFCQGGDLLCSKIHCFKRNDCAGVNIPGRCCPSYDHCDVPQVGVTRPRPLNVSALVTHQSFFPTPSTSPFPTTSHSTTEAVEKFEEEGNKVNDTKPVKELSENEAVNEVESDDKLANLEGNNELEGSLNPVVDSEDETTNQETENNISAEPSGDKEQMLEGLPIVDNVQLPQNEQSDQAQAENFVTTEDILQQEEDKSKEKEVTEEAQVQTDSPQAPVTLQVLEQPHQEENYSPVYEHPTYSTTYDPISAEQPGDQEEFLGSNFETINTETTGVPDFTEEIELAGSGEVTSDPGNEVGLEGQGSSDTVGGSSSEETMSPFTYPSTVSSTSGIIYDTFHDIFGYQPSSSSSRPPFLDYSNVDDNLDSSTIKLFNEEDDATTHGSGGSESILEDEGLETTQNPSPTEISDIEEGSGLVYNSFYNIPGHYPSTLKPSNLDDEISENSFSFSTDFSNNVGDNVSDEEKTVSSVGSEFQNLNEGSGDSNYLSASDDHTIDDPFVVSPNNNAEDSTDAATGEASTDHEGLGNLGGYGENESHTTEQGNIIEDELLNIQNFNFPSDSTDVSQTDAEVGTEGNTDAETLKDNEFGEAEGSGGSESDTLAPQNPFMTDTEHTTDLTEEDQTQVATEGSRFDEGHTETTVLNAFPIEALEDKEQGHYFAEGSGETANLDVTTTSEDLVNTDSPILFEDIDGLQANHIWEATTLLTADDETTEDAVESGSDNGLESQAHDNITTDVTVLPEDDSITQMSPVIPENTESVQVEAVEVDLDSDIVEAIHEAEEINQANLSEDLQGVEVEIAVDASESALEHKPVVVSVPLEAVEVELSVDVTENPISQEQEVPQAPEMVVENFEGVEVELGIDEAEQAVEADTEPPTDIPNELENVLVELNTAIPDTIFEEQTYPSFTVQGNPEDSGLVAATEISRFEIDIRKANETSSKNIERLTDIRASDSKEQSEQAINPPKQIEKSNNGDLKLMLDQLNSLLNSLDALEPTFGSVDQSVR